MLDIAKIILASQSPRRKELMERAGFDFEIITSSAEEVLNSTIPEEVVKDLSALKAKDVLNKIIKENHFHEYREIIVIGADTVVAIDDQILGKPKSEDDAYDMISMLQGNVHQVYTGVTILKYSLINQKTTSNTFAEKTDVHVYPMTDKEILDYISTGDCMDKAGSYGIQGTFGVFVEKIEGDYNNVVGLPIARLYHEINK